MNILIWNSPFISQGNVYFFANSFKKHLLIQGNALAEAGHNVDIIFTESTKSTENIANDKLKKIYISNNDVINMLGSLYDPNVYLYNDRNFQYKKIYNVLSKKLQKHYDVIMLWENPVPFLEQMYPDTLFVHQMPGVFCRPPYPNFSTFDVYGLYKHGTIYKFWEQIIKFDSGNNFVRSFFSKSNEIFNDLNIFKDKISNLRKKYSTLSLIPLQVSAHYAFRNDTHYSSQAEYLIDVARRIQKDEGLIVTQYVTQNTSDTVINDSLLDFINSDNIIFDPVFDKVENVSQYIVPFIDKIYSISSSLMFHGFLWNKETEVITESNINPYGSNSLRDKSENINTLQRNTIDFFLNRHQILTSSLHEECFLSSILEELVFKKKNKLHGLDRYCDPISIDRNYMDKVFESFRKGRSSKSIANVFPDVTSTDNQLGKIRKCINNEKIKIVSFDIFDTLVSRVLEKPVDLFYFLQEICFRESNGVIDNFSLYRIVAEKETRLENEHGETTLDSIYEYIERVYNIKHELLSKMKKYELYYEMKFSTHHPFGKEVFQCAIQSGKRIIFISDMYLPKSFIEKLLNKNGYNGYDKLYISCELGLSKRKGDIFPHVIEDCKAKPNEIIHFGDNKSNDIKMAEEYGITTYYLCNAITRMRINKNYHEIFPPKDASNKSRAACVGLIALRTFSKYVPILEKETLFLGSAQRMGYNMLGMLVLSYALWLARSTREMGLSTLYFLSREGWLIKQVYDIVSPYIHGSPKSEYLYVSRRALNIAIIENETDIINVASLPYTKGTIVCGLIKSRFGVDINPSESKFYDKKLDYILGDRILFINICKSLYEKILNNAKEERHGYIDYLKSKGCYDVDKMAIVDIGWKGRMQVKLSRILNRKIYGFYYGTISGSENALTIGNKIRTYLSECSDSMSNSFVINNRKLCEVLICNTEKSLESIKYHDNKLVKYFIDEPNYNTRKIFIHELHAGCIDFATDFVKYFDEFLETMFISPELSTRILSSFAKGTLPRDAELVSGVNFCDNVGGLKSCNLLELIKYRPISVQTDVQKNDEKYSTFMRRVERKIIFLLCSNRKRNKYIRSRDHFFTDSKSILAKFWYKTIS